MTKTPKTYTISLAEIRAFVEKQPKDSSYIGECGNPARCLVARALQDKYRPHAVVVVSAGWMQVTFQGRSKEEKWHNVETEDHRAIAELIHEFDSLRTRLDGNLATKADVLPLFDRVAA